MSFLNESLHTGEPVFTEGKFTGAGDVLFCFCRACLFEFTDGDVAIIGFIQRPGGERELIAFCDKECLGEFRSMEGFKAL